LRRRRYYGLTKDGRRALARQRSIWERFFTALDLVAHVRRAAAAPAR